MTRKSWLVFPPISLFLLCFISYLPANAATINAASCSSSDVQQAINSSADGDTVVVPAGTCTWSSQVSIPAAKGITLQGAGAGSTIIDDGVAGGHTLEVLADSRAVVTRITGFTFDSNGTTKSGELGLISINDNANGSGGLGQGDGRFRIDHITFNNLLTRGIIVWMRGTDLAGLIDHCTFNVPGTGTVQGMEVEGTSPQDGKPFSRPYTPGTVHAIYIEDSIFSDPKGPNDGAEDAYTGARYVFRHNTVYNTITGHHGADSGSGRGIATAEFYNNTYIANAGFSVSRVQFWRSAPGVSFNNTATTSNGGTFSDAHIVLDNYRDTGSYAPWGGCDGTSAWDQNLAGQTGWACLDQVGHFFTPNSGGSNTVEPVYIWGNLYNGAQMNGETTSSHIQDNRDFYNQNASFNGSAGMGVGTLSARPSCASGCATNVGYWATDTQTLYQFNGTSWAIFYTPFPYPHPLQGQSQSQNLQPPTGLTEVVN